MWSVERTSPGKARRQRERECLAPIRTPRATVEMPSSPKKELVGTTCWSSEAAPQRGLTVETKL